VTEGYNYKKEKIKPQLFFNYLIVFRFLSIEGKFSD